MTLRGKHRLRVFENRVLRRIFGPKYNGLTGEWRKLNNEELKDLYFSRNIFRVKNREKWSGLVMWQAWRKGGNAQGIGGKTRGKETTVKTKCSWDGNINIDHQELECDCWDCIELAQGREMWQEIESTVMNLRIP
jgi:hypothetical protein